jgi:hypothetical protein
MAVISKGGSYWLSWIFFLTYWFYGILMVTNIILGCLLDF